MHALQRILPVPEQRAHLSLLSTMSRSVSIIGRLLPQRRVILQSKNQQGRWRDGMVEGCERDLLQGEGQIEYKQWAHWLEASTFLPRVSSLHLLNIPPLASLELHSVSPGLEWRQTQIRLVGNSICCSSQDSKARTSRRTGATQGQSLCRRCSPHCDTPTYSKEFEAPRLSEDPLEVLDF
jgi:hypothetical protein